MPGAVLVGLTAAGLVLLVQSPSTGGVVALVGAVLLVLGAPVTARRVRRRPDGFLPLVVVSDPAVVRSAVAAAAVPAAWFGLLIAVPAVLVADGWEPWQVGALLIPSAVVAAVVPRVTGPLLSRIGPSRSLAVSATSASAALLVTALGVALRPGVLGVAVIAASVLLVTFAFLLGQPALSAAVGQAVPADVRGVALGVATLVFLTGGSVGSAVVGGIGDVIGMGVALLVLAVLPLLGLLTLRPLLRHRPIRCPPLPRPQRPVPPPHRRSSSARRQPGVSTSAASESSRARSALRRSCGTSSSRARAVAKSPAPHSIVASAGSPSRPARPVSW